MPMPKSAHDDGAVIGYKPKLEYNKQLNGNSGVKNTNLASESTNFDGNVQYSETLNGFSDYMPSKALEVLDNVIDTINSLIGEITPLFSNGISKEYGDITALITALQYGDTDFSTNFINYHFGEISGSQIPEMIGELFGIKERVNALSSTLKELFYGNPSITTEEASQKDTALLESMKSYEISGNTQKINYAAVSFDSIVGRSAMVYGYEIGQTSVNLRNILLKHDDNAVNPAKMSSVKRLFSEVNDEISYRKDSYNAQQSVEIMQKTLYNYYNERSELMDAYDLFSGSNNSVMLGTLISKKQTTLTNAIEEIIKTFMGNRYYLEEVSKLEQEKSWLRDIYAGFNYN